MALSRYLPASCPLPVRGPRGGRRADEGTAWAAQTQSPDTPPRPQSLLLADPGPAALATPPGARFSSPVPADESPHGQQARARGCVLAARWRRNWAAAVQAGRVCSVLREEGIGTTRF